jgi:protein-tyrosine phosphatase
MVNDLEEEYERLLPLEACLNLRDVGGYPTSDGRRTRWRTLLRADNINKLRPASQQSLLQDYGVRTIIDLRDPLELKRRKEPPVFSLVEQVKFLHLPIYGDEVGQRVLKQAQNLTELYCTILDECRERFSTAMQAVATEEMPLLVHCASGKDRTGLIIALALAVAGVPEEIIAEDYALTEKHLLSDRSRLLEAGRQAGYDMERYERLIEAKAGTMLETFAYLHQNFGGPINYLQTIGISEEQLTRLRMRLVQ